MACEKGGSGTEGKITQQKKQTVQRQGGFTKLGLWRKWQGVG